MSISLQSLVDLPTTPKKRPPVARFAMFSLVAIVVMVVIAVIATATGVKFFLGRI